MVCRGAARQTIEKSMAGGIEVAIMGVLRQLPRNRRIMSAVRQAAMTASRTRPEIDALTNRDWSARYWMSSPGVTVALTWVTSAFTWLTTARVEAWPALDSVR